MVFGLVEIIVLAMVLLVVLVAVFWVIAAYNKLVRKRVRTENAWSQIDVQLKRRHDLIPNLVNTVKGYASHERETLESVIKARQQAVDASSVQDQAQAENLLTGALRQLFALSENYPDLKANQNFAQLQEELVSTENRIGFARQHYSDATGQYNTAMQQFPTNMIASLFSFEERSFFEIEDPTHRETPEVQF